MANNFEANTEAYAALTAERDQLRAQLETASGNARHYADRCVTLEAEVERLRVEIDAAEQAGFYGRSAARMRAQRDTATARAEAAEGRADGLRRGLCDAVRASGGVANDGVSDTFLIIGVPAEMAARKEAQEAAESTAAGLRRALEKYADETQWGLTHDNARHCDWFMSRGLPAHKQDGWVIAKDAIAATPDEHERKIQADVLEEIANLIRQTTPDARSDSNYDRGMFNGRYRAIEQIETAVKELRGGDGMQAFLMEDVKNEAVAVGVGAGAPPGGSPIAESELSIARQAAVDLAKKVATLRTAMFEIRQHSAPSGIESGDLAIEAIAIRALEDTEAVEKTQPGPDAAQLLEWYSKNDTLLCKLHRHEGRGVWCFFNKNRKSHSRDAEGNPMDFQAALREAWEAYK